MSLERMLSEIKERAGFVSVEDKCDGCGLNSMITVKSTDNECLIAALEKCIEQRNEYFNMHMNESGDTPNMIQIYEGWKKRDNAELLAILLGEAK